VKGQFSDLHEREVSDSKNKTLRNSSPIKKIEDISQILGIEIAHLGKSKKIAKIL
jgi:hypothetical protein